MIDPAVLLQVVTGKLVLSVKPFAFKVISKHSLTFVFTDYVTLQHFATAWFNTFICLEVNKKLSCF